MILRKSVLAIGAFALASSSFTAALSASDIPADTPSSELRSQAAANFRAGNLQDALVYYDLAIDKEPTDDKIIYSRAGVYLQLGKTAQAGRDLDKVLALNPKHIGALQRRADLSSRAARWIEARQDYAAAGQQDKVAELDEAEGAAKLSIEAEHAQNWEECVVQAGTAILVASKALDLRQRRARCRLERGEVIEGLSDLNHALQIASGLTEPYLQVAAMTFYSLGETGKGIAEISKCLHNDPDNKACAKLRKSMKGIERTLNKFYSLMEKRQFASAVKYLLPSDDDAGLLQEVKDDNKTWREANYIHPRAQDGLYGSLVERACEAYTGMNSLKKAEPYCDEALTYNADCLPALLSKAQRQMDADEFEPAIGTLNHAKEAHGNQQKIQELMQNAQTLLKRSRTKDYYKVLGLSRDADEREIKRAWRKLTIQFHPDKAAQNGISQEEAQKKMAAINEAHEVLSDPELKARFDQGDDPNDPQSGHQPFQGSPFGFGPGGQPVFFQQRGGGGGGGGFKFQGGMPFGGGGGFPGGFPFG